MVDVIMCAVFWARHLACSLDCALLQPKLHGCKSTCGLWLQQLSGSQEERNQCSVLSFTMHHLKVLMAQDVLCLTWLACFCTYFLLAAIPGDERTILRKVPKSQRWSGWWSWVQAVPELWGHLLVSHSDYAAPHLLGRSWNLAWPCSSHQEKQMISRAALMGDAAQGIAEFTSGTTLRGSLQARQEEVTTTAWLRSSKTAEGRKANEQAADSKGKINWLAAWRAGLGCISCSYPCKFLQDCKSGAAFQMGRLQVCCFFFLNKQTWAYLSSLTQHTGISIGFITCWQACWGKQERSMAVFEADHKSLVTLGSRLTD